MNVAFSAKNSYENTAKSDDGNQLDGDIAGAHLSEDGTAMVAALALGGNLLQDLISTRTHEVN